MSTMARSRLQAKMHALVIRPFAIMVSHRHLRQSHIAIIGTCVKATSHPPHTPVSHPAFHFVSQLL